VWTGAGNQPLQAEEDVGGTVFMGYPGTKVSVSVFGTKGRILIDLPLRPRQQVVQIQFTGILSGGEVV
jgi:hypothetical protein